MTYTTFNFAPGINKDDSPLASEGGYIDGDKVRFVSGRMQTIGGWDTVVSDTFDGIARGSHAWADLQGSRYIAFGTADKLHAIVGGQILDITPPHSEGVITNPFFTTDASAVVRVLHPEHGFITGQTVTYPNIIPTVGGLLIAGSYVVTVTDANNYRITHTIPASSTATGGGVVYFTAALPPGLVSGVGEPGGYGTGVYGAGGYGGSTSVFDFLPRVWFLDNWGETLVALPRGGALYQWQPAASYPELVVNGTFDSPSGWTLGAGWSIAGGAATATAGSASSLSRAINVRPGYVYRATVVLSVAAGSVSLSSDAGSLGASASAPMVSGTYSRRFRAPAAMTEILVTKDTAFIGSIYSLSITLESAAYKIDEAPYKSAAMFVDPHQIVVLLGTFRYLEPFNAMAVRWCDRENINDWVPSVSNLAGDAILSQGSRLVSGIASRQENMVWSDPCAYTMQFTNDAANPFNFNLVGSGCGLIGALARCEHNGIVVWAASGNFYRYAGGAPESIPSTMRRDFFDNLSSNQGEKVACGVLPAYSEVWFFKPDSRDGYECSRYAAVRWDEGTWTSGTFGRSSWIKPGIYDHPIAFGADGKVYYHEIGATASGGTISWFIESAYFDIADGENLAFLRRIIGDFDDLVGPANFTVYGRPWPTAPEQTFGPYMHAADTRKIDLRVLARQLKIKIDGTSAPAFARLGALRLDIVRSGAKR